MARSIIRTRTLVLPNLTAADSRKPVVVRRSKGLSTARLRSVSREAVSLGKQFRKGLESE